MKLSDLVAGLGMSEPARLCGNDVVLRLVPEGVIADLRAELGAPVPPEDPKDLAGASIYQAACRADRARFELLVIMAAVGVVAAVVVGRKTDGGAVKSRSVEMTAVAASQEDAICACGAVAGWVGAVLPMVLALNEADLASVRKAYRALTERAEAGVYADLVGDAEKK